MRLTGPTPTSGVVPADGPLDIVFEDPDLIVLNKAPGVLVHPGHGHFHDTLGNFLMYHYKMTGDESDFHPVHRLDKGTSGLLAVAKHPFAQEKLKGQLHTGGFRRTYLAVCDGAPPAPSGTVDAPIGPVDGSLMARRVRPDGKPARTHYRVLRSCGPRSLLELELETGRTHQIRVHMASIGHPILGDDLYSNGKTPWKLQGQTLHAATLGLIHPVTGAYLEVTAPLPEYFSELLKKNL